MAASVALHLSGQTKIACLSTPRLEEAGIVILHLLLLVIGLGLLLRPVVRPSVILSPSKSLSVRREVQVVSLAMSQLVESQTESFYRCQVGACKMRRRHTPDLFAVSPHLSRKLCGCQRFRPRTRSRVLAALRVRDVEEPRKPDKELLFRTCVRMRKA